MSNSLTRRELLKRAGRIGAGLTLGGGLVSACARGSGSPTDDRIGAGASEAAGGAAGSATPPELALGLLAPLTGAAAAWGPLQADGFRRAVESLNAAGGIQALGGTRLRLEVVDTETKPEVAASQAERLAQDDSVIAVSGCNQSGASIIVAQVAQRNAIPFITGTDADPLITEQGSQFSFRVPGTTEVYPRDMLEWVKAMQASTGVEANKVAILSSASQLGETANEFAQQHAERLGFEIVAIETYDTASVSDFTPFITRYQSAGVQTFLGTHDPEPAVLIIRAMKQQNWQPVVLGGMFGAIATTDWIDTVGGDGNFSYNAFGWSFNSKGLGMEEFNPTFEEQHGTLPSSSFDPPGYAVVSVLVDAIERIGGADRGALRDAVAETDMGPGEGTVPLLQMNGVKFDATGANERAATFVQMVEDGQTYVVSPEDYAVKEAVFPRPPWSEL